MGVGLRSALFCVFISLETDFSPIWNFCGSSVYILNLSRQLYMIMNSTAKLRLGGGDGGGGCALDINESKKMDVRSATKTH